MSQKLVAHSSDLKRLRDEGFNLQIVGAHVLIREVPYVNGSKEIKRGVLVSTLNLAQDVTIKPDTHVATFIGECPCDRNGNRLDNIIIESQRKCLTQGVEIDFTFSSKPTHGHGYADYYEKLTTYVRILSNEAKAVDSSVTAKTFPVIALDDQSSPFKYLDTASSRAGIEALSLKLAKPKIAIVGLGERAPTFWTWSPRRRSARFICLTMTDSASTTPFAAQGLLGSKTLGRT